MIASCQEAAGEFSVRDEKFSVCHMSRVYAWKISCHVSLLRQWQSMNLSNRSSLQFMRGVVAFYSLKAILRCTLIIEVFNLSIFCVSDKSNH